MFKKHTEGHVLMYVTIASFNLTLVNCDGEIIGLGVTNWMDGLKSTNASKSVCEIFI